MSKCRVSSLVWFRVKSIPRNVRKRVARDLRIVSRYGDTDKPLRLWRKSGSLVGIPVAYGLTLAKELGFAVEDKRSLGKRVIYRKAPTPRTRKQETFFTTLVEQTRKRKCVFAVAPTGSGKTIAALNLIHSLGRSALVIVPTVSLANQWKKQIVKFLKVHPDRIGILKSGKCVWQDKSIVVAVVHSLCKGRMKADFHNHFGIAIWDEAHRMGANWFSKSLLQARAKYRIALTATPTRKDGMTDVLHKAFYEPNSNVKGNELVALPCTAYVLHTRSRVKCPSYGSVTVQIGMTLSKLVEDRERNALIAKVIRRGYKKGRDILVLSDRIAHLETIMGLLDGIIPSDEMGLFIGKTKEAEQERIKESSRVIFATYGMMKEGQDIPRLSMGIDITPRSEGNQVIGRIRREFANKPHAIWVTLLDVYASQLLQRISFARIKDYKLAGATVIPVAFNLSDIEF